MTALSLVLQQLPGVDHEEFRNLISYYDSGKTYLEALKGENQPRSPQSTKLAKSTSGISSISEEEKTAKPSTTTPARLSSGTSSLSDEETVKSTSSTSETLTSGVSSQSDEEITKSSTTTSGTPTSGVCSQSDEEIAKSSTTTSGKKTPLKVKSRKERAKPEVTAPNNLRIMYLGRDILNLERNAQPHKWQLISPLFSFYTRYATSGARPRFEDSLLIEEYKMIPCGICDYYEPYLGL